MKRFLRNADTPKESQRPEQEVLHSKRCRLSDKHFEMLLLPQANKIKSFLYS